MEKAELLLSVNGKLNCSIDDESLTIECHGNSVQIKMDRWSTFRRLAGRGILKSFRQARFLQEIVDRFDLSVQVVVRKRMLLTVASSNSNRFLGLLGLRRYSVGARSGEATHRCTQQFLAAQKKRNNLKVK